MADSASGLDNAREGRHGRPRPSRLAPGDPRAGLARRRAGGACGRSRERPRAGRSVARAGSRSRPTGTLLDAAATLAVCDRADPGSEGSPHRVRQWPCRTLDLRDPDLAATQDHRRATAASLAGLAASTGWPPLVELRFVDPAGSFEGERTTRREQAERLKMLIREAGAPMGSGLRRYPLEPGPVGDRGRGTADRHLRIEVRAATGHRVHLICLSGGAGRFMNASRAGILTRFCGPTEAGP